MILQENFSLKKLNTFGIDVKARYYLEVDQESDIREVFTGSRFGSLPLLILGGGSNILFTRDFPGLVVRITTKGKQLIHQDDDHVIIEAQAGEDWDQLVQWAVENNWGGLENLSLIPGQAGTSPIQNIGAYGVELKDVFHSLTAMDKASGLLQHFTAADCAFGYRDSIFKNKAPHRYIILSVRLKLSLPPHRLNTSYGAIGRELQAMGCNQPGLAQVRQAVCNIRNSKLPDPKILGNAGSFFKNPVVDHDLFELLKGSFPDMVAFPSNNGVKLAAGWLIEQAGWKGYRQQDAGVHQNQALVLVNYGSATGVQIMELAKKIQDSVLEKFAVKLEPEVNVL